jgi:hypothetical protein
VSYSGTLGHGILWHIPSQQLVAQTLTKYRHYDTNHHVFMWQRSSHNETGHPSRHQVASDHDISKCDAFLLLLFFFLPSTVISTNRYYSTLLFISIQFNISNVFYYFSVVTYQMNCILYVCNVLD